MEIEYSILLNNRIGVCLCVCLFVYLFIFLHSKKDADDSNNPLKSLLVDDGSSTESATKTVRTTKQYGCNQCLYSADKKVSLNRHMRMHQTSPASSSVTSNGDDCSSQVKTIFYLQFSVLHDIHVNVHVQLYI